MKRLLAALASLFKRQQQAAPEHRTTNGGHLAPHPGMTDADLYEFECAMKVPNPTFPSPPWHGPRP